MNMSDLHVLHLDHSVEAGGAELALVRMLKFANWNPVVVLPRQALASRGVFSGLNDQVVVLETGPNQPSGVARRGVLAKLSLATRLILAAVSLCVSRALPDGPVHANSSRSAVYGALFARARRRPLVVHLRDIVGSPSQSVLANLLFTQVALRCADAVIANSRTTLRSAEPHLSAKAARWIIPSPIGLCSRPSRCSADRLETVGMIARLAPWKGQHVLVRAFATVFGGTGVRLRLVGGPLFGEENYEQRLRVLVEELGIADQVDFTGHVDNVWGELELMDLCVHCSVQPEPLGQNVLQYLSLGKPVIAANVGGPAEWIDHERNGLLFEAGSVSDLARNLLRLRDDHHLRSHIAHEALHATRIFTDEEVAVEHGRAFRAAYEASL